MRLPVSGSMREPSGRSSLLDRKTVKVCVTLLVFCSAVAVIWVARDVLAAFLAAVLFGYLMERPVRLVRRWTGRPRLSIAMVYAAFAAIVGAGAWLGTSAAANEMDWLRKIWTVFGEGTVPVNIIVAPGWRGKLMRIGLHLWSTYSRELQQWIAAHAQVAVTVGRIGFWAVVVPILSIWIVRDKAKWIRWLASSVRESKTQKMYEVLEEMDCIIGRYVWSEMVLVVFAFIAFSIALSLLHMPHPILLAGIAATLELVFVLGPLTATVVLVLVALLSGDANPIFVLLFIVGWRLLQDYVNTPLLFGSRLQLHPLMIVLSIAAGWHLGGVFGMFIAVPIVSTIRVAWDCMAEKPHLGRSILHFLRGPV